MPTLRSAKRLHSAEGSEEATMNSNEVSDDKKKVKVIVKKEDEISQWVMIGPNNLFSTEELAVNSDIKFCKLPHPQNGVLALYIFMEDVVFELMSFKHGYQSWFIDETVQKDGSLFIATPVDPLFIALPYLEKAASLGQFTTLDNILTEPEHPLGMQKLEKCLSKDVLLNVCDCKGTDDLVVFKSNDEKILQWLSKKVTHLADHLMKSKVNVQQGAQISGFVQNSDEVKNKDDCVRYAWSMVSDYLVEKWSLKLKEHFEIKDLVKAVNPPAAKKQRLSEQEPCLEDYRDKNTDSKTTKKTNTPKLTTAQKKLNKVDKKGMKTMASFFKATPKK